MKLDKVNNGWPEKDLFSTCAGPINNENIIWHGNSTQGTRMVNIAKGNCLLSIVMGGTAAEESVVMCLN